MLTKTQTFSDTQGQEAFRTHLRPYLANLLSAIGLDVVYHRAAGDSLYMLDENDKEQEVLDLLGGYGVNLLGHNHPALVALAKELLDNGRPFAAQASARSYAGLLADRLSEMVTRTTGKDYITTLGSTGTEAVEAAIKHAELEAVEKIDIIFKKQTVRFKEIRTGIREGKVRISAELLRDAERKLAVTTIKNLDALEYHLTAFNQEMLMQESCFLALEGAFHGKTSGSLKMTYNPDFRNPWQRIGIPVHFLAFNDSEALERAATERRTTYYQLTIDFDGEVRLAAQTHSQITACFIEPIQGEGGIRELTKSFMQSLRAVADREGFPLVMDEIQSGMGRCGSFLASEASGIKGDYYLFSKALGGGLAKISALLVEKNRYIPPFGYIHTSTFADDDFASAIALRTLEILDRDQQALIQACGDKGAYLLAKLREIQTAYPQVIKDVRGRGLMIGIELASQEERSNSPLLRVLAAQNLLGFLLSGYLLNEENIRISPTISAHGTIRVEPSAYISYEALDRFCNALKRAASFIENGNTHSLVAYLAGRKAETLLLPREYETSVRAKSIELSPVERRVAFLGHFIEPQDLLHWDESLAPLSADECERLLARTQSILKPFPVNEFTVRGNDGRQVAVTVFGVPYTADQMMEKVQRGEAEVVLEAIQEAVDRAREMGCSVISFGGFTSIVTQSCTALTEDRIGLTSGNSLTAAAVVSALETSVQEADIDREDATLGVVGAMGNIGKVLAEIEAASFPSVILFGREGGRRRLERVANQFYLQAWERIESGQGDQGIARKIAPTETAKMLRTLPAGQINGKLIREGLTEELGEHIPLKISTDLADLRHCAAIITATNSPTPIIHSEHLGEHPAVICDVAVPGDVSPNVRREKPLVNVLKGGLIEYPFKQSVDIGGMSLPGGQAYACLTEAVLLGLAGIREHYSYGALTAEKVRQIGDIAKQYGFKIIARQK